MAITAAEQAAILQLTVLMFDAAPGTVYGQQIVAIYESQNHSLSALGNALDDSGAFLALHPADETPAQFADAFLTPLGLEDDAVARQFVLDQLAAHVSKGVIAATARDVLMALPNTAAPQYLQARAILENKAEVAAHYTFALQGAATDLATLQGVLDGVTADDATVATVIDQLDDALATGPSLTSQLDAINAVAGVPTNITGIVDGDADGGTGSGTYSAGDVVIGNGNTNLKLNVRETGNVPDATLTNIETIYLSSEVAGNVNFDADKWTGIGKVRLDGGVNGLTVNLDNMASGAVEVSGVTGRFNVDYDAGVTLALNNTVAGETTSFALTAAGAVTAVLGDGATIAVDSDDGLGDIAVTAGDGASFDLGLADDGDLAAGDIAIDAGADATIAVHADEAGGDVALGDIAVTAGAGGDVSVLVNEVAGSVTTGNVTIATGASGAAEFEIRGVDGDVSAGDISVTGGAGSNAGVVLDGTEDSIGALSAGDIAVVAGANADASLLVEDFASVDLGAIDVSAGGEATARIRTVSGDVTFGDATLSTVGAEAVMFNVSGIGGDVNGGTVSLAGGAKADLTLSVDGVDGDVTLAGASLTGGAESDIGVTLGAAAASAVDAGAVNVSAGESSNVNIDVSLGATVEENAATIGALAFGGATVEAGPDTHVTVLVGQHLDTTTEEAAAIGDLTVGDFGFTLGDNATVALAIDQVVKADEAATFTDGDFLVGDVNIAASATGEANLSGGSTVHVDIVKSANPGAGAGGTFTVGDVSLSVGNDALLDLAVTYDGYFANLGAVSIGNLALEAGDDSDNVHAQVRVANQAAGDIGAVTLAGASVHVGDDSEGSLDITLQKGGMAGDIGKVSIGALDLAAGDDSTVEVDFDVFGLTADATVGDIAIGAINVALGEGAEADLSGLSILGADIQSAGKFSVGAVTATLAEDAQLTFAAAMAVDAAMGDVTLGAWNLTLGEGAKADMTVNLQGDVGQVTMGAIALDLAQSASASADIQFGAADEVGGVTVGNVTVAVDDGAEAKVSIVSAADEAGDMVIGDVTLSIADLGITEDTAEEDNVDVAGSIDVTIANNGSDDDTLTLGKLSFDVEGEADGDEIRMAVSSNGDVVIGDIAVSGKGTFILDGQAHMGTADLNTSYLQISAVGEITVGNVDFSGYEGDVLLDMRWVDHGAAGLTAGAGDDTIIGGSGNNVLAGGDGVDIIDLTEGGVDTVVTSNGDSGKTALTIDSILGFSGGTNGAGDKLDFNLVAGAANNYVEGTGAADMALFLTHAKDALNTTVRYFAEVVGGTDVLVAVNYGSGEADMVVKLVGVTALTSIGFQNFVA